MICPNCRREIAEYSNFCSSLAERVKPRWLLPDRLVASALCVLRPIQKLEACVVAWRSISKPTQV